MITEKLKTIIKEAFWGSFFLGLCLGLIIRDGLGHAWIAFLAIVLLVLFLELYYILKINIEEQ